MGKSKNKTESSEAEPPPIPKEVDGRYEIRGKIGSGSYSVVHLGYDRQSGSSVAVKLEWIYADKTGKLLAEAELYKDLEKQDRHGAPKIYWSGTVGEYNLMVMELLGPSIEELMRLCGNKLSLKTVLMVGKQMIDRLEYVHSCGILHRDIKPNNFLIGTGENKDKVYIMDFGLAKRYLKSNGRHIDNATKKGLTGTVRYTTHNVHRGLEPSRRDDMGSIGYVLIYLALGRLPWQGINAASKRTKQKRIGKRKEQVPLEELCKDLPHEFVDYMEYCDRIGFDEQPDYTKLRSFFERACKTIGLDMNEEARYDWHDMAVCNRPLVCEEVTATKATPKATKRSTPAPIEDSAKRRKVEEQDVATAKTFIWNVPPDKILAANKGDRLESDDFKLEGPSGTFRLRYWPKGHKKAATSSCSAYVWASVAATLQMKLYVNKKCKMLDKDGPVYWKSGNDRGYADFCAIPEGDVQLKVVLLSHTPEGDDQLGGTLDEYDYDEYETDTEEDSEEELEYTDAEESEEELS